MITTRRMQAAVGTALVLILAMAGAWLLLDRHEASSGTASDGVADRASLVEADPSGARTTLPGLTPPTGEPVLPGLETAAPRPGSIERLTGPFDDRFSWSRLRLGRTGVSGTVTITSDVSDVLELQVLVGFYDVHGRLLGTRRFVHHAEMHDEAAGSTPNEAEHFAVPLPRSWRGVAVAATVGVPVLVNE